MLPLSEDSAAYQLGSRQRRWASVSLSTTHRTWEPIQGLGLALSCPME